EAGWTRPEVLLRRARAVGARGLPVDEAEARRLLRDLDTALGAGLALDGRAHAARALALARLRQPDQAAAALAACDAPAPAVEWAVALARVVVGLDRSGEMGLSAQLPASAPPPAHADEARALATLARERAGPALRTLRRDPDALTPEEVSQAVDRMVVAARLAPDTPVEPRDVDALIGAVMSVRRRIPARVAVHLVSLAPDDRKLLAALARFARAENTSSKRQLLPVVRRAYDLAVTVEERRELGLFLCIVLDGLDPERPHDVDALVTELLLDDERDDVSRSTLYELRQKARRHLGRFEEALADVDEALRLVPERDLLLVSRAQVLVDLGRRDEGLEVALDYVRRTEFAREAKVSVGSLDHAARLVWEVGVPLGRAADVRRVLERYLVARAERWGWAARAAHLALLDGDRADALDLLQRAANALQKEGSAAERAAFGLPLQAAHDAVSAEAPDADARLRRLVDELDRVRSGAMLP
ncbi:MAG: hypothetical protein KF878_27545, partial [Planctomycetes bacterium]|nr:hypothetical protein [Planctomycetota bacterium]